MSIGDLSLVLASGLLTGIVAFLWLPLLSDAISSIKALTRRNRTYRPAEHPTQRLLFLVPAHDEEKLIAECVESIRCMRYPAELLEIVAVADHCSDRTAAVARAAGARCLERNEPPGPGKPDAIAWAIAHLDLDSFDALVIVDADSVVAPDFGREIGRIPDLASTAVQPYNGVSNPQDSPITRMATVLAAAYYRFAYPLKQRAGLNVPLTGAGMCLGAQVLRDHGWTARSLAEDVECYTLFTLAGIRSLCRTEARIFSVEAPSLERATIQRHRWRRGRLEVARTHLREILTCRRIGPHQKLDLLAELVIPGPAVHLAVVTLGVAAAWTFPLPGADWIGALAVASLLRPTVYSGLGLGAVPDRLATVAAFLALPLYTAWRLRVEVLGLLRRPPWTRSRR